MGFLFANKTQLPLTAILSAKIEEIRTESHRKLKQRTEESTTIDNCTAATAKQMAGETSARERGRCNSREDVRLGNGNVQ